MSLFDALKAMKAEDELDEAQVQHALLQFDAAINDALALRLSNTITIAGQLDVYRHCDNIWTMIMRDARLVGPEGLLLTPAVKLVAPEARRGKQRTRR